jgi:hypothetical protein
MAGREAEMTEKEKEEGQLIVEECLKKIGEHFEVVQIMASNCDGVNGTNILYKGAGNYYARLGMAHDFITSERQVTGAQLIADKIKDKDDE